MAAYAKELATAEVAYAAIDEVCFSTTQMSKKLKLTQSMPAEVNEKDKYSA